MSEEKNHSSGTTTVEALAEDTAVATAGKTMAQAELGEGPDALHPMAKAEFE